MHREILVFGALVAMVASFGTNVHADVYAHPTAWSVNTIEFVGIIADDPDPVTFNGPIRPPGTTTGLLLNPGGNERGDKIPYIIHRPDGRPIAVWAYLALIDFDVAFSEWDGVAWTPVEFLASGSSDEFDPRVFLEPDGTLHVIWWTSPAEQIYRRTRAAGSTIWGTEEHVGSGRRPSIAVAPDGTTVISFERDVAGGGSDQEVVALWLPVVGPLIQEVIVQTPRTEPLDSIVHRDGTHLWIDWKHSDTHFGVTQRTGSSWGGPMYKPWPDPTWVGVEETRHIIRRQVIRP